jgi:hypothetical protein
MNIKFQFISNQGQTNRGKPSKEESQGERGVELSVNLLFLAVMVWNYYSGFLPSFLPRREIKGEREEVVGYYPTKSKTRPHLLPS